METKDWRVAEKALADLDAGKREDVERLCSQLAANLDAAGYHRDASRRDTQRWRQSMRLLLDGDGYTEQQVAYVIDWVARDAFWSLNVRSPFKLREHFERFVAQIRASRLAPRTPGRPASARGRADAEADEFARAAERARAYEAGIGATSREVVVYPDRPHEPPRRRTP